MSTPSPEKDSLLGPTVHKKIEYQNLKGDVFFAGPFTCATHELCHCYTYQQTAAAVARIIIGLGIRVVHRVH